MIRRLLYILAFLLPSLGWGQFTYFNQIAGGVSDTLIDLYTNVEVLGEELFVYGGIGDTDNGVRIQILKFSSSGELLDEEQIFLPYDPFFLEVTSSFVKTSDEEGFIISIPVIDTVLSGWVCHINASLDSVWSERYDQRTPYTSLRRNVDVGDGIVIAGETQPQGTQSGTMLLKIDFEGNEQWITDLEYVPGVNTRLSDIGLYDEFLIAGGHRNALGPDNPPIGMFTKCDPESGEPLWEYTEPDYEFGMTAYDICQTTTGKVLAAATVQYENAPLSELSFWTKLRILELDIENELISETSEYFYDYEMDNGFFRKIIPTNDGGVLLLGQKNAVDMFEYKAYLLKLDSMGNQDWFNYYAYNLGDNQLNEPYDIEQTSDGGYIVAGQYSNWNVSIGQRGWLLKIDACGDVEWQGCELADGLWDTSTPLGDPLSIYPNPAQDYLYIEAGNIPNGSLVEIADIEGRSVLQTSYREGSPIDITSLSNGIYGLRVSSPSTHHIGKVMVQR